MAAKAGKVEVAAAAYILLARYQYTDTQHTLVNKLIPIQNIQLWFHVNNTPKQSIISWCSKRQNTA